MRNKSNRYYLVLLSTFKKVKKTYGEWRTGYHKFKRFALDAGLGDQVRRRSGDTTFYMLISFSILISELEQRRFEPNAPQPKVRFLNPWAVFCRAVWCPNFRAKRSIKTIRDRNVGFMTYFNERKIKVSLPIDVHRMPLLELPIKKRKKRQCCAKIKKK